MDTDITSINFIKSILTDPFFHGLMLQFFSSLILCCVCFFVVSQLKKRKQKKAHSISSQIALSLRSPFTLWFLLQWIFVFLCQETRLPASGSRMIASLLSAWLFIRLMEPFMAKQRMLRSLAFTCYIIAILAYTGILSPIVLALDNLAIEFGNSRISLWSLGKGALMLSFVSWISRRGILFAEKEISSKESLEPFVQALLLKAFRTAAIVIGGYISLNIVGIDLSTFALLGGAIGVGIGFGLQKIVANVICGVILLLDRSIKPGDIIALNGGKSYGEIRKLGLRYVAVRTRSGKEHLIPNEILVTERTENWSHSDSRIRLSIPIRAPLESDVKVVMDLISEAAKDVPRILLEPVPGVRLSQFGEYATEFELRVWIDDPWNGVSKIKSDVYVNVWKLFRLHHIKIPYPHRDIHMERSQNDVGLSRSIASVS